MNARESIDNIIANSEVLRQFVKGGENVVIPVDGGSIPSLANLSKNVASIIAATLSATSNSTVEVGVGERTFAVQAGKGFRAGQWVTIVDGDQAMAGIVTSYTGVTLVVDVSHLKGAGIYNAWSIYMSSMPGLDGVGGSTPVESPRPKETLITKLPWEN